MRSYWIRVGFDPSAELFLGNEGNLETRPAGERGPVKTGAQVDSSISHGVWGTGSCQKLGRDMDKFSLGPQEEPIRPAP